jgi:drug/metabolite transporter (DMT)-like permease
MRPYLLALGAILCWASLAAAVGRSLERVAPELILFYGLLTAGALLAVREWIRTRRLPAWPGWRVAALGVYGIWGYHQLLIAAFALAPDVEANILNYTWPLWIVVLGSWLSGQRHSRRAIPAAGIGFSGAAWVLTGGVGLDPASYDAQALLGLLLALGAGFCWGSFTVLLRRWVPAGQSHMALFCLLAAALAGAVVWARGLPFGLPLADLAVPIYVGLVPLGMAFALWERAVQGCNLQTLGLLSFLTPPLSVGLQALVNGEPLGLRHVAGLALVLGAAAWGSRSAAPKKTAQPQIPQIDNR